jgi:hypothetical protein
MSIEENIRMGKPGATRQEIEEAAIAANAYDFITSFPDGFETPISGGSGSTQLSGGQKVSGHESKHTRFTPSAASISHLLSILIRFFLNHSNGLQSPELSFESPRSFFWMKPRGE